MIALLPTVSCLMCKSDIAVTEQFIEPCSMYSILIGFPSTKKSICLNFIKSEFILANNHVNLYLNNFDMNKFQACFTNNSECIVFFFHNNYKIYISKFILTTRCNN